WKESGEPAICHWESGGVIRMMHAGLKWHFILVFMLAFSSSGRALPKRLVIAIDGVAYLDVKALQEGVSVRDASGRLICRRAFEKCYFPVSRNVSTYPSTTDVAWTRIFGNPPLPGYQRTYYSYDANTVIAINPVGTSMEFEKQMHWRVVSGWRHAMGYLFARRTFKRGLKEVIYEFWGTKWQGETYYAYFRSSDDAQHMDCDIREMLCTLDEQLRELRERYLAVTGQELEVLILSDHGNNHAGPGKRVQVRRALKEAGYHVTNSLRNVKDVVLPTAGIESWVEIHNAPEETENLLRILSRMKGADVITAKAPGEPCRFIVMNRRGERAT